MMTSKERVAAAIERRPVDRLPIFMWFHPETTAILAEVLEIPAFEVGAAMGNDVCQRWVGNNFAMEGIVHENEGDSHVDYWGIKWGRYGGFNQIMHYPLEGKGEKEVSQYRFPYDRIDDLLRNLDDLAPFRESHFIGCDVSPCIFEFLCRLFGMNDAMLHMAIQEPWFLDFLRSAVDFNVRLAETACDRYALDWLWTGDDVGGQQGMMLDPVMWREVLKPQLKRIFDVGKRHGLPVAYHSCGGIRPIIGDLIEIGLDVLNPIQCDCPGMDALELKREFGRELTFMGGVDTIGLLPNGTADEVRKATRRLIDGMTADGGGYILAASHTVPPETPLENIFAMYHEAGLTREMIFDTAADIRKKYR